MYDRRANGLVPYIFSKKTNGSWLPCGDFRLLNARKIHDDYPVRHIQNFTSELDGKTVFSVIDCKKAYHHIPVNPGDVAKTAVITHFGLFEFKYMVFGLRNAAQTFQRFMDDTVKGLDFVFPYLDDVLVASSSTIHVDKTTRKKISICSKGLQILHPSFSEGRYRTCSAKDTI